MGVVKFDGLRKPPAPLDAHDLAVQAFGDTVGDGVLHEAQHTVEMSFEHARDLLHRLQAGSYGPAVPL